MLPVCPLMRLYTKTTGMFVHLHIHWTVCLGRHWLTASECHWGGVGGGSYPSWCRPADQGCMPQCTPGAGDRSACWRHNSPRSAVPTYFPSVAGLGRGVWVGDPGGWGEPACWTQSLCPLVAALVPCQPSRGSPCQGGSGWIRSEISGSGSHLELGGQAGAEQGMMVRNVAPYSRSLQRNILLQPSEVNSNHRFKDIVTTLSTNLGWSVKLIVRAHVIWNRNGIY